MSVRHGIILVDGASGTGATKRVRLAGFVMPFPLYDDSSENVRLDTASCMGWHRAVAIFTAPESAVDRDKATMKEAYKACDVSTLVENMT